LLLGRQSYEDERREVWSLGDTELPGWRALLDLGSGRERELTADWEEESAYVLWRTSRDGGAMRWGSRDLC
jgi:hypothetical protein